jgi:hypothetical protein
VGSGLPSVSLKRVPPRMPPKRPWSSCDLLDGIPVRRVGKGRTSEEEEVKA